MWFRKEQELKSKALVLVLVLLAVQIQGLFAQWAEEHGQEQGQFEDENQVVR